ncbi:MAG: hypothetical protein FWD89_04060, partial [Firmicutes bacterium]|nr:hypothetical protein [Bacillota bacterium]
KANCYVVNVPSKVNQITKSISFQRDVFKDVYSKIKASEKSKNFYISILDFFEKEIGESISFLQFVFCLLVFVELGFISVINTDFNFECKVLKESRKELNESPLYEKLREIANGNN